MRHIIFAAMVAATPAVADTPAELHQRGMEALERCENAWFRSRKLDAIDVIREVSFDFAPRITPGTDEERQMLSDLTDALRRCRIIIYGEGS